VGKGDSGLFPQRFYQSGDRTGGKRGLPLGQKGVALFGVIKSKKMYPNAN